jgi:hypothetical protein
VLFLPKFFVHSVVRLIVDFAFGNRCREFETAVSD